MPESEDVLLAVETLCEIVNEIITSREAGIVQWDALRVRLSRLQRGCQALREGYRTGLAAEILSRKGNAR